MLKPPELLVGHASGKTYSSFALLEKNWPGDGGKPCTGHSSVVRSSWPLSVGQPTAGTW